MTVGSERLVEGLHSKYMPAHEMTRGDGEGGRLTRYGVVNLQLTNP
jgi:hypothetical protein